MAICVNVKLLYIIKYCRNVHLFRNICYDTTQIDINLEINLFNCSLCSQLLLNNVCWKVYSKSSNNLISVKRQVFVFVHVFVYIVI